MKEIFDTNEIRRTQAEMWRMIKHADSKKQTTSLTGKNCFVCYLDLDGFKEKIHNAPHDLFEAYQQQRESILGSFFRAGAEGDGSEIILHHYDKMLWPYMFSDSWFFATIDSSQEALNQISSVAAGVMMRCLEIGLPAHGAIAEGPLWWQPAKQIILGPGLTKAYLAAESMDCFGIAVHSDLANRGTSETFTLAYQVLQKQKRFRILPIHRETKFCR